MAPARRGPARECDGRAPRAAPGAPCVRGAQGRRGGIDVRRPADRRPRRSGGRAQAAGHVHWVDGFERSTPPRLGDRRQLRRRGHGGPCDARRRHADEAGRLRCPRRRPRHPVRRARFRPVRAGDGPLRFARRRQVRRRGHFRLPRLRRPPRRRPQRRQRAVVEARGRGPPQRCNAPHGLFKGQADDGTARGGGHRRRRLGVGDAH
mmetsp:Transcript_19659/g.69872  ORF Transcript_19659/g.69872 Transcript_19659/m.69872 type:complete len:206 (-) Transcript_19659:1541-2158(-)